MLRKGDSPIALGMEQASHFARLRIYVRSIVFFTDYPYAILYPTCSFLHGAGEGMFVVLRIHYTAHEYAANAKAYHVPRNKRYREVRKIGCAWRQRDLAASAMGLKVAERQRWLRADMVAVQSSCRYLVVGCALLLLYIVCCVGEHRVPGILHFECNCIPVTFVWLKGSKSQNITNSHREAWVKEGLRGTTAAIMQQQGWGALSRELSSPVRMGERAAGGAQTALAQLK